MKSSSNSDIYAVILAGGSGSRMGSAEPKQFLELGGRSLLEQSIFTFLKWGKIKQIVVVSAESELERTRKICQRILRKQDSVVSGGKERHDSEKKGLEATGFQEMDYVFIHDAARPFFTSEELDALLESCDQTGISTLARPVVETVFRQKGDLVGEILNREELCQVKTPQIGRGDILRRLLSKEIPGLPTDLTSWALYHGINSSWVSSHTWNIKITHSEDLELARLLWSSFPHS